jgi:hypothetical protein
MDGKRFQRSPWRKGGNVGFVVEAEKGLDGRPKLGKRDSCKAVARKEASTFGTTRNLLPVNATKEDAFAMHHYSE